MIDIRAHRVMGRVSVSVWCSSHGEPHCLWAASRWTEDDGLLSVLAALSDAARECYHSVNRGEVDDASDECGL